MALEITDESFSSLMSGDIVVIDFWAQWCGPCRMLGPIIDELENDYKEDPDVTVGKLNVDQNPKSTAGYGIRGIPAVLFFKNGELADKLMGANPKSAYEAKIESLRG